MITDVRISIASSNVVKQFLLLLKSSVTLTILSSLTHKSLLLLLQIRPCSFSDRVALKLVYIYSMNMKV